MRAEEFGKRPLELEGWTVHLVSYRIGDRYVAEVEDISSGVTIARNIDEVCRVAEEHAIETAVKRLSRTRRVNLDLSRTVGG